MPYIYRVSRRTFENQLVPKAIPRAVVVKPVAVDEPSYRDLQAQAKALNVPANQTADDLKKAIAEASDGE